MSWALMIPMFIAAAIMACAEIWLLVEAFKKNVLWGLGILFPPTSQVVLIVFVCLHWQVAKKPFLILLSGVVVFLACFISLWVAAFGDLKQVIRDANRANRAKQAQQKTLSLSLNSGLQVNFIWIEPGKFRMGSPVDEKGRKANETPHEVTLTKGFWMQNTLVTQAQWKAVMGENPSHFKGDDLPVENVSWEDCQGFLKKLKVTCYRELGDARPDLPTEAEWEYACRAGGQGRWHFGDDESALEEYAWYSKNAGAQTHPIGQKKPNAWNLFDINGNVWQWCKDRYGEYWKDEVDPLRVSGNNRVLRGGSWLCDSDALRSAFRSWTDPAGQPTGEIGLRVVLRMSK